jgi:hypothetical protein
VDEFFTEGSPYCLLCSGDTCNPETHKRYAALVELEQQQQIQIRAEIEAEIAAERG